MAASTIRNAHLPVSIAVVVCTYNRAADLDRVLARLAAQQPAYGVDWSVLVVDNASTDNTPGVVEAWLGRGVLPGLRSVVEPAQGLSHARARGFRETTADWIAFVDDDNLLASDWLAEMGKAIARRPDAGGMGGRVILDWVGPRRPYLDKLGWCFAEQDHGTDMREVGNLVGAGMVLRRRALLDCGWPDRMLVEDRVGTRLISGGDVEIAQRVKLAGHPLWYAPKCILQHRITADRMGRKYVVRLAFGLGVGAARVSAVCAARDRAAWTRQASSEAGKQRSYALSLAGKALLGRADMTVAAVHGAFAAGYRAGIRSISRLSVQDQQALIGAALPNGGHGRAGR